MSFVRALRKTRLLTYLARGASVLVLASSACLSADTEAQRKIVIPAGEYVVTALRAELTPSGRLTAEGDVTVFGYGMEVRADAVEGNLKTGEWTADGNVVFTRPEGSLYAESLTYNSVARAGSLQGAKGIYGSYHLQGENATLSSDNVLTILSARGTTCDLSHPHWALTARRIDVHGNRYAVARGLGLWIGKTKVFALPSYRIGFTRTQSLFPIPGYDGRDGAYLRFEYPVSVPGTSAAGIEGRITVRNGIQAAAGFEKGLGRPEAEGPKPLTADIIPDLMSVGLLGSRLDDRHPAGPRNESEPTATSVPARDTHAYLRLADKQRVFDPDVRYLSLDRLPEVGLRTLNIPAGRAPVLGIPMLLGVQTGYGRFRERGSTTWIGRWDARASLQLSAPVGQKWQLDPVLLARYSRYSGGAHQSVYGYSIALGRRLSDDYFAAVTYVDHIVRGVSPFEFDNVDVETKLAMRLQGKRGPTLFDVVLDFDLEEGGIYDWGVSLARSIHCYQPRISYHNRYRSYSIDVTVIAVR